MKCVFLCSVPISHIIPIQPIVEFLINNDVDVTVISSITNKERIQNYGAEFIEYPFNFTENNDFEPIIERGRIFNKLISDGQYEEAYNYFIKEDIKRFYDHSFANLNLLFDIVKKEKPDFIIRDAVDRYGTAIAKLLNIPCIGWITHCLYSRSFFESNPIHLYRIFLDSLRIKDKNFDNYLQNFRKRCEDINEDVFINSTTFKINTLHQFDPCEELTLINSIKSFQPHDSFEENRKYLLVYPKLERFQLENNIDLKLIEFVNNSKENNKKVIYISTGSMLSLGFDVCLKLIDNLINNDLHVIMSNNSEYIKLKKHYISKEESVYVDKFIPQQYVLANSNLFISSAGQNSILEAIYHKVPLLAVPLTSEQKLNGYLIENAKIGKSTYFERDEHITFGTLVKQLLTENIYYENLEKLNYDLVTGECQFDELIQYVYERKKGIKNFYIS